MSSILFIDDQPPVLRGLERMLRAFRHQADCLFVHDPQEAIVAARTVQPDIVVTDMRMPGIDGLDVLDEVRLHCPSSARLVLSGDVGLDTLGRMMRVVHQCLNKPCSSEDLTARLSSLLRLRERHVYPRLRAGLFHMSALPFNPAVYAQVQDALKRTDDTPHSTMLRVLWDGPGLSGKLLQISGWAGVGTGHRGEDLRTAVAMWAPAVIGVMFEALQPPEARDITPFMYGVWRRSRVSSRLAETIALDERLSPHDVGLTSAVTLLSSAGPLVLEYICHEEYRGLRQEAERFSVPLERLERAYFGVSAQEVMAWLARLWGLPDAVVDLLDQCASPFVWAEDSVTMATIARLSQAIGHADTGELPDEATALLRRLGRLDRLPDWASAAGRLTDTAAA